MTERPHRDSYAQPNALGLYPDDARRISDAYTLHLVADPAGAPGKWMVFALADGRCVDTLYDSKSDAIRSRGLFAKNYGYMLILATGCDPRQAASYLRTCRLVADNPNVKWLGTDYDAPVNLTDTLHLPFNREGNVGRLPRL